MCRMVKCAKRGYSLFLPILTAFYRFLPILTAFYRFLRFLTDSYRFLPIRGYFFALWAKKERPRSGKGAGLRGRQEVDTIFLVGRNK